MIVAGRGVGAAAWASACRARGVGHARGGGSRGERKRERENGSTRKREREARARGPRLGVRCWRWCARHLPDIELSEVGAVLGDGDDRLVAQVAAVPARVSSGGDLRGTHEAEYRAVKLCFTVYMGFSCHNST